MPNPFNAMKSSSPQSLALDPLLVVYMVGDGALETVGRTYPLSVSSQGLTIGNAVEVDISVQTNSKDSILVRIYQEEPLDWYLEDLTEHPSVESLLVNDLKVRRKKLQDGDRLQVGSTTFRFLDGGGRESRYFAKMSELIGTDVLTGLSNRRQLHEQLLKSISYCDRNEHMFSLLCIDVDDFSQVNNTHGHPAGDAVLKELTARIRANIRTEDIFGREGGEEFIVGFPGLSAAKAYVLMERVRAEVLKEPVLFEDGYIQVTFSAGLSEWKPEPSSAHKRKMNEQRATEILQVLKNTADRAMYRAKKQGKNRVIIDENIRTTAPDVLDASSEKENHVES